MNKIIIPILSAALLSSCMQTSNVEPVSQSTILQLTGTWVTENKGSIRFYSDETVKINMPNHTPPVKLLSPFEAVKDHTLGIALGGFWSGPILIDTSKLTEGQITATFPEEATLLLHKQ